MAPMLPKSGIYWDPATVFNLDVNSHTFHCLGTTKQGNICKRAVKQHDDRDNACRLLQDLSHVPPKNVTISDLMPIATWLLCPTNHRGSKEQERTKAYAWHKELQYFIAYGVSQHQAILDAQKTRQQIASEQAARDAASTLLRLTQELREAHMRLAAKETECEEWKMKYAMVKVKNKELKVDHAELSTQKAELESNQRQLIQSQHEGQEAATLEKAHLEDMLSTREGEIKETKVISAALRSTLEDEKQRSSRLVGELQQRETTIETQDAEVERLRQCLEEQFNAHNQETAEVQGELATREAENTISMSLARNSEKKLHRQLAASVTENADLKTKLNNLRTRSHCRTLTGQVSLLVWQRRCQELRADNEALLGQHKKLQEMVCEVSNDLQAVEKVTTPLKLQNVRKGICAVFSVQPLRIRAQRLSDTSKSSTDSCSDRAAPVE